MKGQVGQIVAMHLGGKATGVREFFKEVGWEEYEFEFRCANYEC